MVGYYCNINHIRAIPIKNRQGQTITEAWEKLYSTFAKAGAALQIYMLDNEKSRDLTNSFNSKKVQYQLMLPHKHCKPAERVIQVFKNHFKAVLAGIDLNYLLAKWD